MAKGNYISLMSGDFFEKDAFPAPAHTRSLLRLAICDDDKIDRRFAGRMPPTFRTLHGVLTRKFGALFDDLMSGRDQSRRRSSS